MKKLVVAGFLIVCGACLRAQSSSDESVATTDLTYASQYVFRGLKRASDSVQPSADITFHDAYVGIWTDQPLQAHHGSEIDLYAGYKYSVSKSLSLEAVDTYYDYPGAGDGRLRHSDEAGVGATYVFRGIAGTVYYYHDFKLNSNTEQGSMAYSLPLERIGTSLDWLFYLGTVQSANGLAVSTSRSRESYNYYGVDVTLPYKVSQKTSVALGVHWAGHEGLSSLDRADHLWWSLGASHEF